jgi:hypothetical protein
MQQKIQYFLIAVIFLAGCVTVTPKSKAPAGIATGDQLRLGMSIKEVMAAMGDEVVIGYERSDDPSGTFVPIIVKQPHRKETLRTDKRIYRVLYYFSQIRSADDVITDDELTPYIFEFDRYIGKGWGLLEDIKSKEGNPQVE